MNIKDNITNLTLDEAKNRVQDYDYAVIYNISSMIFDNVKNIASVDWNECKEAYFFNDKGQMHIYEDEDGLKALAFSEPDNIQFIDSKYELANKHKKLGKYVIRREYISYDEDGQIIVDYTRLVSVE